MGGESAFCISNHFNFQPAKDQEKRSRFTKYRFGDKKYLILKFLLDPVMASASSTSAKNLFAESKRRLAERVQVNINNVGSITRQMQRGSKSNEMLQATARNLCQTESTMDNTLRNLQRLQVVSAQTAYQQNEMAKGLEMAAHVNEQINDMQR